MATEHRHDFVEEIIKDPEMLSGERTEGVCECGCRRLGMKVEIRWLLNSLMDFSKWDKKIKIENLSAQDVVRLIKENKAFHNYEKFDEEYAQQLLNNLDKFV
jgi:hypothetical protein